MMYLLEWCSGTCYSSGSNQLLVDCIILKLVLKPLNSVYNKPTLSIPTPRLELSKFKVAHPSSFILHPSLEWCSGICHSFGSTQLLIACIILKLVLKPLNSVYNKRNPSIPTPRLELSKFKVRFQVVSEGESL